MQYWSSCVSPATQMWASQPGPASSASTTEAPMMSWSLVSCVPTGVDSPVVAALTARGTLVTVPPLDGVGNLSVGLERWAEVSPVLRGWEPADGVPLADARVLAAQTDLRRRELQLPSKGLDTFCPLGPGITPSWFVPDPQARRIRLWRNGVLQQDAGTDGVIFPVARLVAAASEVMTLEPGDVIATGTPAGVGVARGEALRGGDVVRVEIDRLGTLDNPIGAATPARLAGPAGPATRTAVGAGAGGEQTS